MNWAFLRWPVNYCFQSTGTRWARNFIKAPRCSHSKRGTSGSHVYPSKLSKPWKAAGSKGSWHGKLGPSHQQSPLASSTVLAAWKLPAGNGRWTILMANHGSILLGWVLAGSHQLGPGKALLPDAQECSQAQNQERFHHQNHLLAFFFLFLKAPQKVACYREARSFCLSFLLAFFLPKSTTMKHYGTEISIVRHFKVIIVDISYICMACHSNTFYVLDKSNY